MRLRLYIFNIVFLVVFIFVLPVSHGIDKEINQGLGKIAVAEGNKRLKAGRYKDAIEKFNEAKLYDSSNFETYLGLGKAYYKIGDIDKAKWNFTEALVLQSGIGDAHFFLGTIAFDEDKLDIAKRHLEEAISLGTTHKDQADYYLLKIKGIEEVEKGFREKQDSWSLVKVRYKGQENAELGSIVVKYIVKAHAENSAVFNIHTLRQIEAIIYTDKQFQQVTYTPAWTGALYDGKIRIRMGGFAGQMDQLERLIRHEVTHALVHHLAGSNCPVWLSEGLAQVREGDLDEKRKELLGQIARSEVTIPLQTLEDSFFRFSPGQVGVAYMVSLGATLYLVQRAGYGGIVRILQALGQGQTMENALTKELSLRYQDLNYNYKAYLKKKYK